MIKVLQSQLKSTNNTQIEEEKKNITKNVPYGFIQLNKLTTDISKHGIHNIFLSFSAAINFTTHILLYSHTQITSLLFIYT